jgi:general secretion pathway protein I
MRIRRTASDRECGLTLIELAVAILVLSIGAMAATRAGDQAQQALAGMEARTLARIVAQNRAEELRLFGSGTPLPGVVQMGGQEFVVEVNSQSTASGLVEAAITVRSALGPGTRLVAYVRRTGPGS